MQVMQASIQVTRKLTRRPLRHRKTNVSLAALWNPAGASMKAIFDRHNQYRCMHGVPPFRWNDAIAQNAAKWGREANGKMVHSNDTFRSNIAGFKMLGENLAWGGGRYTSTGGVDEWHKEILLTENGTTSNFSLAVGHYTALVWRDTTDVGCAVYKRLLVCQYGPIGNTRGLFRSQVLPITKGASECGAFAYKNGIILDNKKAAETPVPEVEGKSLTGMVERFINEQSGSGDHCHSQMLESKQQLNGIAQLALDLFNQLNATEDQLAVAEVSLQSKLRELTELDKWQQQELEKCRKSQDSAIAMYAKLQIELKEMKQIANPSIAMNISTGRLHEISFAQGEVEEFQGSTNGLFTTVIEPSGHHIHLASHLKAHIDGQGPQLSDHKFGQAAMLIKAVHTASHSVRSCLQAFSSARISVQGLGVDEPEKTRAECETEKAELEKVYVKAYVELSRLLQQYEDMMNSTACFDAVESKYLSQKNPLQEQADDAASVISELNEVVKALRPQLDDSKKAEEKIRSQVEHLMWSCGAIAPTASDLDKVRDAIYAMSDCPGLTQVKFALPRWTGTWAFFIQDAMSQDDAAQDEAMNQACSKTVQGSRAAEVDELQERTVDGMPETNSAPNPLIGLCPNCAGNSDDTFVSGHGRVCWDPGKKLTLAGRSEHCGMGKKAVLCVVEENHRKTSQ